MSASRPSPSRPRAVCSDLRPITHQGQETSETKSILMRALIARPHSNCTWSLCRDIPTQHVVYPGAPQPGIFMQDQVHEQKVLGIRPRTYLGALKIGAHRQRANPKVFEIKN